MLDPLDARIKELDQAIGIEAERRPESKRLMQQPRCRPGDSSGFCNGHWPGGKVPPEQAGRQLFGTEPARAFFRGVSAPRINQQTRKYYAALVANRSGTQRRTLRF